MVTTRSGKRTNRRFPLQGLSIQQRLPLFIFILLLSVIGIFTWISWIAVRNAAVKTGHERLVAITTQLSSIFGQSAQPMVAASLATAKEDAVINYLLSGGKTQEKEVRESLQKLAQDKPTAVVALLDTSRHRLLESHKDSTLVIHPFDSLLLAGIDSVRVGRIYLVNDSMYYPVVVPVVHEKKRLGYIVRWRLQYAPPKTVEQFSQLIGTDASLFIGNADGSLWTDLEKTVPKPPVDIQNGNGFFEFSNASNKRVVAAAKSIPNTRWVILVEFSRKKILESSNRFLEWAILAGIVLIGIGLIITGIMSRNITRPLKKLTAATSAIAAGNYSLPVETDRRDELGKLARSFNAMTRLVHKSQQDLEKKVQERTIQLETLNKELEAFSYSISHDLRAPLRIIDGYSEMLHADYNDKLDGEGNRLLDIIQSNVQRMGQLIDDLLDFSQIGRKELMFHTANMNGILRSALAELSYDPKKVSIKIGELENAECDSSLMRQVWINLVGNAIKYSGKTQDPEIAISSEKKDGEIVYTIKDNGVGFDMKFSDKLFGVFQRLHKVTEFDGTGIGLALVKRILARHGGTIWAESEKGMGATFYFSLPVQANSNSE
ncbi:MAG: ATP-binding protein [Bacteroidota bacterium]